MRATSTAVSDRFTLVDVPRTTGAPSFAQDVADGLRAAPKRLPSKYLYDDVGSALFDAIALLPEYYLTRAEREILHEWGWEIVRVLDEPLEFVELGSGNAAKTRLLIEEALRVQGTLRYSPIDISTEALRVSSMALVEAYPGLSIRAYAGDYFDVLASSALQRERRVLAMFMGSNIGNYEPDEAVRVLQLIAAVLRPGDAVLLGTDETQDPAVVELAYDDPVGITAAFNKNLLARVNRELGADFDLGNFSHVARYDVSRACVDSFLEARDVCVVHVPEIGAEIAFDAGERMQTESAYKFDRRRIASMATRAGLQLVRRWHDAARRFSVSLLVRG